MDVMYTGFAGAKTGVMFKDERYAARRHDCMDAGVRTNQETESRKSEAAMYRMYCQDFCSCKS